MAANPQRLESPKLRAAGFAHAFFTRAGGVSKGAFESLNFSSSVGDDPRLVEQNFALAAAVLGVHPEKICHLDQVHGADSVRLSAGAERAAAATLKGDAAFSDCTGLAVGVRTADCVPVLVGDQLSGAVLAIHAGWRGVVASVVGRALEAFSLLAPRRDAWISAIGPHISPEAFEISEEVARQLELASEAKGAISRQPSSKPHADLRRIVRTQLEQAGLREIDDVEGCTFLEPERFFSYRRQGAASGRHLSAIVAQKR